MYSSQAKMLLGVSIELIDLPPTGVTAEDALGPPDAMAGRVILWRVRKVGLLPGDDDLDRPHLLEPGLELMGVVGLTAYLNPLDTAKVQSLIETIYISSIRRNKDP
jgi:hypothetical protein